MTMLIHLKDGGMNCLLSEWRVELSAMRLARMTLCMNDKLLV